jgi:hypothetical protein
VQLLPDPPKFAPGKGREVSGRGHSSAGRASRLQREGRRFDPDWLHQLLPYEVTKNRVMTRAHENHLVRPCAGVIARFVVWSEGEAFAPRLLFNNLEVFVLTLNFQAKI